MPEHGELQIRRRAARPSPPDHRAEIASPLRQHRRIAGTLTLRKAPFQQPDPTEGDRI